MEKGVLFISPDRSGPATLSRMLAPVGVVLESATNLQQARGRLHVSVYPVILTDTRLPDGSWVDVLNLTREMELPSSVIVTDPLADDLLWAEVLNLGAYDLLVQPFDTGEVQRILSNACARAVPRKGVASPSGVFASHIAQFAI